MAAIQQTRTPPAFHPGPVEPSETLARLHREMTALFGILPVPNMLTAQVPTEDAEIEAQFDNLPV